ncbi:MAG: glycosyltransferase [Thermodesulfobacteriota bacterium]
MENIINNTSRTDMHVHSKYSYRPASWILKKIGCAESYTDPFYIYKNLKEMGMDFVTITDHNTIQGCLDIAHLPDTFISEEVTTYFPEDGCKLHVLVYDITEKDHEVISSIRQNVFDLVDYLNEKNIVHSIAHPMFSINGKLEDHHFHRMLLLFKNFELNGAKDNLQNQIIQKLTKTLTKEKIEELSNKYSIKPRGKNPWVKVLTSGSDDHSSLYMGYSFTETKKAENPRDFLTKVNSGYSRLTTQNSRPETLAHNLYSILYQFYDVTFNINEWINDPDITGFLKSTLLPHNHEYRVNSNKEEASSKSENNFNNKGSGVPQKVLEAAKSIINYNPELKKWAENPSKSSEERGKVLHKFVNDITDLIVHKFADDFLNKMTKADLFYLFTAVSSSASLYMMMSPYFIAYYLFSRDRGFCIKCMEDFNIKFEDKSFQETKIAVFTDTFNEINGVASAVRSQIQAAKQTEKPMTLITCDPDQKKEKNIEPFSPIGEFNMPEYPELKIYYPPFLKLLNFCWEENFTHIHAETPGAMGLTALAVSNLLNISFYGTYHTSLPQTVGSITGDNQLEDLLWKYMIWFYNKMDKIFSPSSVTANELVEKGIPEKKIIVHPWGVDTEKFNPVKKNGFFKRNYDIDDSVIKLLYVGRVSKEKNLHIFESVMRKITQTRDDVCLIVIGDGPYLEEMKNSSADLPVLFTGYMAGEELSEAYASADIFVFPSTVDTMGNVVMEAQASGIPVVITDKGGPSENIISDKTGIIVSSDENFADKFADAVLSLCNDHELTEKMKVNARNYTNDRSFENSFLSFWSKYNFKN